VAERCDAGQHWADPHPRAEEGIPMARIRSVSVLCTLLLLVGLASASRAQTDITRPETGAVSGKVVSVDTSGKMLTVEEPGGTQWVFTVNDKTTFKKQDTALQLSALKPGWHVVVNYDQEDTGNLALLVEAVDTP
jgi:hypothetical protein